jgi:hypothetical protein
MFPRLARWHVWLGWLVAVPLILWTASGLFMVSFPIDQVRGTHLRADAPPLPPVEALVLPTVADPGFEHMELRMRVDGPMWVLHGADGSMAAVDAQRDVPLRPVDAALASRIANAALKAPAPIASVRRFAAEENPIDLRSDRPAWQVEYGDGVRVYVDAVTGQVLAVRTRLWRVFDVMWGLHIMDLQTREDTSHPLLIGFAALSLISILFGSVLMFRRRRARVTGR